MRLEYKILIDVLVLFLFGLNELLFDIKPVLIYFLGQENTLNEDTLITDICATAHQKPLSLHS